MKYCLLCFLCLLFCCQPAADVKSINASLVTSKDQEPTRRQLLNRQFELGEMTVVYGASSEDDKSAWEKLLPKLSKNNGRSIKLNFKADSEISKSELGKKAIYLLGNASNNHWIAELQSQLPCDWNAEEFNFAEKIYSSKNNALNISLFPNPLDKSIPFYLTTTNDSDYLRKFILDLSNNSWPNLQWSSFGYQLFQENTTMVSGYFSRADWSIDKERHWEMSKKENQIHKSEHFTFVEHDFPEDPELINNIINSCESNYENIRQFVEVDKETKKIDYHIYANMEDKGMLLQNTGHGHVDFDRSAVHVIHHDAFEKNIIAAENELILSQLLGSPKMEFLQSGLAIYFADRWQKRGYRYWAKLLHETQDLPTLKSLIQPERESHNSPIVTGAAQASFVAFLIELWGKEDFLKKYSSWTLQNDEMAKLEKGWNHFLDALPKVEIKAKQVDFPYLQGFNFAHEGYQIFNGYGSTLADQSMTQMVNLGSNALAIVPYSYMRNPDKATPLPLMQRAGTENDESVIHSIHQAKEKNCYVMLKPQIWLGSSWTGFVEMKNQKDWDTFFEYYSHWIKHYALLAEIYEVDALSIGVEFVQATLQNQSRWANLFREVRKLYSGHLTYCANWGEEFEGLNFWEELDYIGVNCYYPWSKNKGASKKELKKGLDQIIQKIEKIAKRQNKPIVFTEIGFRSVEHPWVNPHAEAKGREINEADQAFCYETFFQGIEGKDWCKGILWWKWPSYRNRQSDNTAFTPMDKKAEQVVEKYFNSN